MFDSIFINGTVGAGKSTVADALGNRESQAGRPHAVVDLDHIRQAWPAPESDPFNRELELANLRDIVNNFRRAGAERFILAGVLEDARHIPRYQSALQSSGLFVCRLVAPEGTLRNRLQQRHATNLDDLEKHLQRVNVLTAILNRADIDHLVVDSSSGTPAELAESIGVAAGW